MTRDLLYALRGFRTNPTFTAVAVASLALGIGLNTAIFNLVSAVLLQPLPVRDPARLMSVFTLDRINPGLLYCSYPNYKDYRDRNTVFSGLALYTPIQATLTGESQRGDVPGQIVSGNYFDVLGVKPALGRTFLPEEDRVPGAQAVAVIGYAFWTRRFGGSRSAIGATIDLNNRRFTIIGVAPKDFHGANALVNTDLWVPIMMYPQMFSMADWIDHRKALLFPVVGRLKDGVSRQQAQDNMQTLTAQLAREYPDENAGRTVTLLPLTESVIQPNSRAGFMLVGGVSLGASGLVLLIACANVANLLLVRAAGRRKEVALRLALGASRGRLIRQLLTESALLSIAGVAAALALGRWGRDLLWTFRPPWMLSGDAALRLDGRVLAFTLLIAVLGTLVFGLAPAWNSTHTDLATELRERRSPWTRAGHRLNLRSLLVMVQVALSVAALTGAGLFLRSLRNAQAVDPGFDAAHMATVALDVKPRRFTAGEGLEFYARVLARAGSLPGVAAATLGFNAPFTAYRARSISVEGRQTGTGPGAVAPIDLVEPGYFQTLRIPLLRGRAFSSGDSESAPRVAVVNETMARHFWSGKTPIGARIRFFGESTPVEIVGVVKDSVSGSLGEPARLMVYLCLRQYYSPAVTLWVRTTGEPEAVLGALRREVQSLDRDVLLSDIQTAMQVSRESLWAPRLGAVLFTAFGALAGLLTVVGLYGVVSYSVGQRTRELGIRMALGAQPSAVLRQVLAEGMILVFWGLVLGLIATVTISGVLNSLLFGVRARDPLTLGMVVAVLLGTALAACWAPAMRATRIDPMVALRDE
ncbi:MAG TPA: ABC transporter permease [Bryobacteraceae bacterium]|nr:ABC transporter permease [Bryobacteraceae bacterium]